EVRPISELAAERDLQMVSGHRFVKRERLQVVEWATLQLVGIHPVDPRLRAPLRRADVTAARVLRGDVGRHRLNSVWQPWKGLEFGRELAVDPLGDKRCALQQFFGSL